MKKRVLYFDSLKFWAAMIVFLVHFTEIFHADYLLLRWRGGSEITGGKLMVALFAVIAGYFSTLSGRGTRPAGEYIWARYLYFFACVLFINTAFTAAGHFGVVTVESYTPAQIIKQSLMLRDWIVSWVWFIPKFLMGSVLCFAAGRMGLRGGILALLAAAMCSSDIWVAVYLMGGLAVWLETSPKVLAAMKNVWLRAVLLLAALCLVILKGKDPESTFFLFGVSSLILVLTVPHSPVLLRLLNVRWTARLGQNSMAIFLVHHLIYAWLAPRCFAGLAALPEVWTFLAAWAICAVVVIAVSFPVTAVLNGVSRFALELSRALYRKINALWQQLPAACAKP